MRRDSHAPHRRRSSLRFKIFLLTFSCAVVAVFVFTVGGAPQGGVTVTYIKGGMAFSPSYTVRAPYIGQDVEPSLRTDKFGNTYVAGIRGVPAGTDLWYFDLRPTVNGQPNPNYDPYMRHPLYRGQPDSITGSSDAVV